jgi:hypothetical protein
MVQQHLLNFVLFEPLGSQQNIHNLRLALQPHHVHVVQSLKPLKPVLVELGYELLKVYFPLLY